MRGLSLLDVVIVFVVVALLVLAAGKDWGRYLARMLPPPAAASNASQ